MFVWRMKNVWCLQLIPDEFEAIVETVHDIQADTSRVLFKAYCVHFKNKHCIICWLLPADPLPLPLDIYGFSIVSCGWPWTCGPGKVIIRTI